MANSVVFGIYQTQQQVAAAIAEAKRVGFRGTDIGALIPENAGNKDVGYERRSKGYEAGLIGGVVGMFLGAALGVLIADGYLAVPGLADFIAAGELMAALAGTGAGAAVGLVVGGLIGLRSPMYIARRYTGRLRRGNILVSVHCDSPEWTAKAKYLLKTTGAVEIAATTEAPGDYGVSDKPKLRYFGT